MARHSHEDHRSAWIVGAGLILAAAASEGHAAEAPIRIADDIHQATESTLSAQMAVSAGDRDSCFTSVKQAQQYCRTVIGKLSDMPSEQDPFSKTLNDAMRELRFALEACDSGQMEGANEPLKKVGNALNRIEKRLTPRKD